MWAQRVQHQSQPHLLLVELSHLETKLPAILPAAEHNENDQETSSRNYKLHSRFVHLYACLWACMLEDGHSDTRTAAGSSPRVAAQFLPPARSVLCHLSYSNRYMKV